MKISPGPSRSNRPTRRRGARQRLERVGVPARIDPVPFAYSFMSLPTQEHIDLYQRGIERVVKVDRYAGLLVSMHCAGLYDRTRATMPGFSRSM